MRAPPCGARLTASVQHRNMPSRLDELIREEEEKQLKNKKKQRLCADRDVSSQQVQECLQRHMTKLGSDDLWAVLAAPIDCPQSYDFKSRPCGSWMHHTAPLAYDLISQVASNTKIMSTKLIDAIMNLVTATLQSGYFWPCSDEPNLFLPRSSKFT